MKALLNKYPTTSRFVLAILLSCLALFISGLLNKGFVKQYFPYVSCMLLFVATWFLYKTDKQSLKAIGLNFSLRNLSFLHLGLLIGAIALLAAKYARTLCTGESFDISTSIDYSTML